MSDEARKWERIALPLEVRWEGLSGRHTARSGDLCVGGCYIESLAQVTNGEHISFEVQLPTGRWLSLEAEVVYSHPNLGFGVRFTELSEVTRQMLEQLVEFGS